MSTVTDTTLTPQPSGGTRAAALQAMMDRGFPGAVAAGLEAAAAKAAAMALG